PTSRRDDADLVAPPAIVRVLQRRLAALRNDGAPEDRPAASAWPVDLSAGPVLAVSSGRWLGVADLPAGGVGLAGPGAYGAARALRVGVAAAAAAGERSAPAAATVVTTSADVAALVGPSDTRLASVAGVRVVADLPAAVDLLTGSYGGDPVVSPHGPAL